MTKPHGVYIPIWLVVFLLLAQYATWHFGTLYGRKQERAEAPTGGQFIVRDAATDDWKGAWMVPCGGSATIRVDEPWRIMRGITNTDIYDPVFERLRAGAHGWGFSALPTDVTVPRDKRP